MYSPRNLCLLALFAGLNQSPKRMSQIMLSGAKCFEAFRMFSLEEMKFFFIELRITCTLTIYSKTWLKQSLKNSQNKGIKDKK